MKNKKIWIAVAALVVMVAVMAAIWWGANMFAKEDAAGGEGDKTITVEVVHADKSTKTFTYHTDAEYLGTVLYGSGLIVADKENPGMFHTVDGEKAVYAENGAYWALYIGQEYAMTGVDQTPIQDGDAFRLVYTVG